MAKSTEGIGLLRASPIPSVCINRLHCGKMIPLTVLAWSALALIHNHRKSKNSTSWMRIWTKTQFSKRLLSKLIYQHLGKRGTIALATGFFSSTRDHGRPRGGTHDSCPRTGINE